MERAIDADALREKFADILARTYLDDYAKGFVAGLCAALKMPTLTQPNEWISVKDRLPEVGNLIVYADGSMWGYQYGICRVCRKEKAFDFWMPLQEPPESRPPEGE